MNRWFTLTNFLVVGALFWIGNSVLTILQLFSTPSCNVAEERCLEPMKTEFSLILTSSTKQKPSRPSQLDQIYEKRQFSLSESFDESIEVDIPRKTRNNGSLYLHAFIVPKNFNFDQLLSSHDVQRQHDDLTRYSVRQTELFQLFQSSNESSKTSQSNSNNNDDDDNNKNKKKKEKNDEPETHWKSELNLHVVDELVDLPAVRIPGEIYPLIRLNAGQKYLPLLYINSLMNNRLNKLVAMNESGPMRLEIHYRPISMGKLRLLKSIELSMEQMRAMGFQQKDVDEVVGLLTETNAVLLLVTMVVSGLHLLFDVLAFKNDVRFWRQRRHMAGLSYTTVLWRAASTLIVLLYLVEEKSSLLVTVPMGVGAAIELWKVKRASKVRLWLDAGWRPRLRVETSSSDELRTGAFDQTALRYLCCVLAPLLVGWAAYNLAYTKQRSFYSWLVESLVNAVYAFGFLFMTPQLFINYKLKSVAHLPWKAFMYKAFNTLIDDLFAFVITMPTAHRLACFRDDLVFFVYLYQSYLYPVDKSRFNEFGETFADRPPDAPDSPDAPDAHKKDN